MGTIQTPFSNLARSSVIALLVFVVRSKLIPDFSLTLHFVHLIITSLYTHAVPSNLLWWGLQCASAAVMTFVGIWACQYRELRPISFGGIAGSGNTSQPSGSSSQPPAEESSRGRGRARDLGSGGGEYELEEMKARGDQAV